MTTFKPVSWLEEILIRCRPDGTVAAHQITVTALTDGITLHETGREAAEIDVARLGGLIGEHAATIVADSAKAGDRAAAAELERDQALGQLDAKVLALAERDKDLEGVTADRDRVAADLAASEAQVRELRARLQTVAAEQKRSEQAE